MRHVPVVRPGRKEKAGRKKGKTCPGVSRFSHGTQRLAPPSVVRRAAAVFLHVPRYVVVSVLPAVGVCNVGEPSAGSVEFQSRV